VSKLLLDQPKALLDPGRNRKPIDTAGGSINMSSGRSLYTSSGKILISTPDAGRLGVSGSVNLRTRLATEGEAGFIALNSGNSINGSGGHIELISGKGTSKEGADVVLYAGETSGAEGVGGKVRILGGKGTSDDRFNGGDGGDIELKAGEGMGRNNRIDNG